MALVALFWSAAVQADPIAFSGVAAGDMTESSVVLWTRTTDAGVATGIEIRAEVATDLDFRGALLFPGVTSVGRDGIGKIDATGLAANTPYFYRFVDAARAASASAVGRFVTAPAPGQKVSIRFGFSGDSDGLMRPFASIADIGSRKLDYFVYLGDTIYETRSRHSPAASDPFLDPDQALKDYRRKYLENITPVRPGGQAGVEPLYRAQGIYALLDNHELGNRQFADGGAPPGQPPGKGVDGADPANDVNPTGPFMNRTRGFGALLQAYLDYQPIREETAVAPDDPRTDGSRKLYFSRKWGANGIFINVDDRSYRDIRLKTPIGVDDTGPRADNPARTMLGRTQLGWLKQTLRDAQADGTTWKIVAVSSPIDESGRDGGKSWAGGYRAERNDLLAYIADHQIENVVFLTTDDHLNRVSELTYFDNYESDRTAHPKQRSGWSRRVVPTAFTIVAGPIGASGPDLVFDHSCVNVRSLADDTVAAQASAGARPLGLHPSFRGLRSVTRECDGRADAERRPFDFFSPDTFNYVTLDISADGRTLSVDVRGINSYDKDTNPEPSQTGPARRILSFEIDLH